MIKTRSTQLKTKEMRDKFTVSFGCGMLKASAQRSGLNSLETYSKGSAGQMMSEILFLLIFYLRNRIDR